MNQIASTASIGHTDSHRRKRLLDLAELLARSDGGTCQLAWPNSNDIVLAEHRRDLTFAGTESRLETFENQVRAHSAIFRAGATAITLGIQQDTSLPSIDRTQKAEWVGSAADVAPTLDLTASKPKRLMAYLTASNQLLKTSPMLAAAFLEKQLLSAIGAAIDDAAINGDGSGDPATPIGLLADPGLLEREFTTAFTAADILAMEKAVAAAHGEYSPAALGWLADAGTREALRGLPRMSGGTVPLWPDALATGPLGYGGTVSPWAPDETLIFGNFADLLVIQTGQVDILSNPYSLDTTTFIRMTVTGYFDIVALNPGASFIRGVPAE